jgi:hypothetical protein
VCGTDNSRCIRLKALIKDQVILQLVDSGSSNTFISEMASSRVNCEVQNIDPVAVKVANGQIIHCFKKAIQLEWWCCGRTFVAEAFVLPVTAYDTVIGMDWLEKFSPMLCACDKKWVEFKHEGAVVRLQGLVFEPPTETLKVSCDQVQRWHIREMKYGLLPCYSKLVLLWREFLAKFQFEYRKFWISLRMCLVPDYLPPAREYDHTISLLPGAAPVNVRPYRYSPLQKDEIERQVQEMLQSGLISRSVSPFAFLFY